MISDIKRGGVAVHYVKAKGIMHDNDEIFAYLHRFEEKESQLSLWEL